MPLLAGDSHRGLDTPNVYYPIHVACPDFDVVGFSMPGCPGFPHFGHNAHVAWCITHATTDYQDLFVERFDRGDPTRYEFKGELLQADVHHETIHVRDGDAVKLDATVTHHGPIVYGDPSKGYGIALRYTATAERNTGFECFLSMLKATNAEELEATQRSWVDPCNNFLYADVSGTIGYLNRGKVPIRTIANAWLPVPGWSGEHEWQGHIPFEHLARSRNPEAGYFATANNRIASDDYPYYLALDWTPEWRARRVTDRVLTIKKATADDMAAIHAERLSLPGRTYARLISLAEVHDELTALAKERFEAWDGTMDREGVAPAIYSAFRTQLDRVLTEHLLGPLADAAYTATGRGAPTHLRRLSAHFAKMAYEDDRSMLPPGRDWPSVLAQALTDGVADLRERLGDDMDTWRWGRLHHTRPRHTLSASFPDLADLLDPPAVPMGGDGDTPQAGAYAPGGPYVMTGMSVNRYVFDTADWDNSAWVIPLGTSGHPGSVHYNDQAIYWAELRLVPMPYGWSRIASEAMSHQQLSPA